jgi:UDP-N-acetylglucosamine:LPS N-acetylglucosamine transferase
MSTDIDRLAALIREVDGGHTLGAAALAEALTERGVRPPIVVDAEDAVTRFLTEGLGVRRGHAVAAARAIRLIFEEPAVTPITTTNGKLRHP